MAGTFVAGVESSQKSSANAPHTSTSDQNNNPTVDSTTNARTKTRILAHNTLFEASKRMEPAGLYAPGAGLIKLSDNSGWAIVPDKQDLEKQYQALDITPSEQQEQQQQVSAYEEVGSAIQNDDHLLLTTTNDSHAQSPPSTLWLRITHRAGVPITCPPPPPVETDDSAATHSITGSDSPVPSHASGSAAEKVDSDVASNVGSAFLDAIFRTPSRSRSRSEGGAAPDGRLVTKKGVDVRSDWKNPVLPCGMCVEVEGIVEGGEGVEAEPQFYRLRGGQGWIPRQIGKETFAVKLNLPPTTQFGSFWFRVCSKRGIKVRRGPYRGAPSIKSDEDGSHFRFECGEFLRASEIITIFRGSNKNRQSESTSWDDTVDRVQNGSLNTSESFARLYRRRHDSTALSSRTLTRTDSDSMIPPPPPILTRRQHPPSLSALITPGEWVQIHTHDPTQPPYLRQCSTDNPPKVERHRQRGWRYSAVPESGVLPIRKGPSFAADSTPWVLRAGESVWVDERVSAHGEGVTWMRLKDGRGWVPNVLQKKKEKKEEGADQKGDGEEQEVVMILHTFGKPRGDGGKGTIKERIHEKASRAGRSTGNDAAYNSIIARLFQNDGGSSSLDKLPT